MIGINCSCGYSGDIDEFTRSPLFGELPPGVFQCPKCKKAMRKYVDKVWVDEKTGQVMHSTKLEKVQAYL